MNEKILIGIPSYGDTVSCGTMQALKFAATKESGIQFDYATNSLSILTRCFNALYTVALNRAKRNDCDYFCLLHSDIGPEKGWLGKLVSLSKKHEADIISVISPIKDLRGLTSTALDEPPKGSRYDARWRCRRLGLHEIHNKFEPTFTHPNLLLNSGCMLVNMKSPGVEKLKFQFDDDIIVNAKGDYEAVGMSEDWLFSRQANELGLRQFATREIKITHFGHFHFSNEKWGSWEEDRDE